MQIWRWIYLFAAAPWCFVEPSSIFHQLVLVNVFVCVRTVHSILAFNICRSREFTHLNNYRMWFDTDVTDFAYAELNRGTRNLNLLFACQQTIVNRSTYSQPTLYALIWFEIAHFNKTTATSHTYTSALCATVRIQCFFRFCFVFNNFNMIDSATHNLHRTANLKLTHQRKIDIVWHAIFFSHVILITECF